MTRSLTLTLAHYAASTSIGSIPAEVMERAKLVIMDEMACACFGRRSAQASPLARALSIADPNLIEHEAPFHAYPIISSNVFTFGGLKIDPSARVLNSDLLKFKRLGQIAR